jgi:Icc protein
LRRFRIAEEAKISSLIDEKISSNERSPGLPASRIMSRLPEAGWGAVQFRFDGAKIALGFRSKDRQQLKMRHNSVRLLHLSDLHLFADESGELYGVNTARTFDETLNCGLGSAPGPLDVIVITGDVADDGRSETYQRFATKMQALRVPVICCPGNHEDQVAMSSALGTPPLQYCGSMDVGDWRIVAISSHVRGEDWGSLDVGQLELLDRQLAAAPDRHVLVCVHHQPVPVGSPWLDAFGLRNADAFEGVLGGHRNVRAVLYGHVHQESDQTRAGIRYLSAPSTCAQFTPRTESCVMDLRPPGFRWLRLDPRGSIETAVVWLDGLRRMERPQDSRREVAV